MLLRQVSAVAAAVFLGLGFAQGDDAQRGPDTKSPSVLGSPHKIAPAPSSISHSANAQGTSGDQSVSRNVQRRQAHRWATRNWADEAYGGPYGLDAPFAYWAPGRWYAYPGFGDDRYWMPHPEGVWGR
jgi:hypothetical protein